VRHPAEYLIKYFLLQGGGPGAVTDAVLLYRLQNYGFLPPADEPYFGLLRQEMGEIPPNLNLGDRTHRPSVQFLRDEGVFDLFFPDQDMQEALAILNDTFKRTVIEQTVLSRLDPKLAALRLNQKYRWFLTAETLKLYEHYFWNVNLLSFDEWGRYLFNRSAMYDNYMALLRADQSLAFYHLRLDQTLESKSAIKRAQEIAYYTLEEVAQIPGVKENKIKAIGVLTKAITECHHALNTTDVAMGGVLKQMEKFRVVTNEPAPKDINQLAPAGNFSGSGVDKAPDTRH
jgi:hypothetical protein